ncbi:hypothetical protein CR492_06370 [Methylocella silvestris]|uniref:Uncharacterized protein n=1 Tax=Methylocella silvestris TaxID=199596 RepID=A0A2J7TJI2_METSI|nr:hypothetical protein CR492_06370 [Methylocella silvestris]
MSLHNKDIVLPLESALTLQQAPKPPGPEPQPDVTPGNFPPPPGPDIPAPDPAPLPVDNPGDLPLPPITDPPPGDPADPTNMPLRSA